VHLLSGCVVAQPYVLYQVDAEPKGVLPGRRCLSNGLAHGGHLRVDAALDRHAQLRDAQLRDAQLRDMASAEIMFRFRFIRFC
jgi:hypothetical protein